MQRLSIRVRPLRQRRRPAPAPVRFLRWALVVLVATVALFAALAALRSFPLGPAPETRELRGAWHVHTTRSDGRGSPTDVARAARQDGLDFVVLTDHNPAELPTAVREEGVLLVPGEESSTPVGHLVDVGGRRALVDREKVTGAVAAVREGGGLSVVAHPLHRKRPWTDAAQARAADGVEVWSGDSSFDALRSHPLGRLLPALATYLGDPERALVYALSEQAPVEEWLRSLDGRPPKLALCGPDAHGWPPYAPALGWMSLHLTGLSAFPATPAEAAQSVVQELRAGRFYCAVDALAPASGFAVLPADRRVFRVGERLELRLPPRHPPGMQVVVHGPGRLVDPTHVLLEKPGVVLVEVRVEAPGLLVGDVAWPWLLAQPVAVEAGP